MKNKVLLLLGLFLIPYSFAFADITFTDGKWETTFDCGEMTQASADWNDGTICDGMKGGNDGFVNEVLLSQGSDIDNNWTKSSSGTYEYYYNNNLSAEVPTAYGPNGLTIGGITVKQPASINGTLGSLIAGEKGWGDNDSIGFNTTYVYSTTDPDSLSGKSIAWIIHNWPQNLAGDLESSITSNANNPLGIGGGARFRQGDGKDIGTGNIVVEFPTAEKELWIRWYMRSEDGFAWESILYDKSIYLYTASGSFPVEAAKFDKYSILAQGTGDYYQVTTYIDEGVNYGYEDVNGGQTGDGQFHCFEIQIKMDTNQTNGIGRIWIDGVLKAENTSVDWSAGVQGTKNGLTFFKFETNQSYPQNSRSVYVDYDDMVVYNTTPPNIDSEGNPYIGPILSTSQGTQGIQITGGTIQ